MRQLVFLLGKPKSVWLSVPECVFACCSGYCAPCMREAKREDAEMDKLLSTSQG